MTTFDEAQIAHFRKRRKQLVLGGSLVAAAVVGVALMLFQRDLQAAQAQQRWGMWRDENCTRLEGPSPAPRAGAYSAAKLAGVAGTWTCSDGRTYKLADSDLPPAGWVAPEVLE